MNKTQLAFWTRRVALLLVLLTGFVLGLAAASLNPVAQAEVRPSNRRNVPSGSLQSAELLRKINATLQSIDSRLSRIETDVKQLSKKAGN